MSKSNNIRSYGKKYSFFSSVLFVWFLSAVFNKYDPDRIVYAISMVLGAIITFTHIFQDQLVVIQSNQERSSVLGSYVFLWLGLTTFTESQVQTGFFGYYMTLGTLEFLVIIPILFNWLIPRKSSSKFFGMQDLEEDDKQSWIWKTSIIVLFVINGLNLAEGWEFLILVPMIVEPIMKQKLSRRRVPMLTLFLHEEFLSKYALAVSLGRSIFLILIAFMFEFLHSRFWVLIIMGFAFAGFISAIVSFGSKFKDDSEDDKVSMDDVMEFVNRKTEDKQPKLIADKRESQELIVSELPNIELHKSKTEVKKSSSKAYNLGLRLRNELKKPQYNLNHILSTLVSEDFSNGFLVDSNNYRFESTRGQWTPPKDLLIFPIRLGKYDFRRHDEILLLGFNKPDKRHGNKNGSIISSSDKKNKEQTLEISSGGITIGSTTFNMRTLVVTSEQWEDISQQLPLINENTDIAYTGFDTIQAMQVKLQEIGHKWIELRKKIQDAAMNFVAGFVGGSEPIFTDSKLLEEAYSGYEITDGEPDKDLDVESP